MSYLPSFQVVQNVVADTNNSYDGQVNSGVTWEGAATSTLGVAGIQVSLKSDQNCTIYVEQSAGSDNWDIVDTINYWAASGGQGWTVQAIKSYVRVRVKNIGAANTSTFRLETALCPIVEAVPRTLDSEGRFQTAVKSLSGYLGTEAEVSPQGNLRTVQPSRLVGSPFFGSTLDSNFWVTTGSTGAGAGVTLSSGAALVSSGTTSSGVGRLQSVRTARYVAGSSNYFRSIVYLPAVTNQNVRRWGMYDDNDGFFFVDDYSDGANHVLKLVCRKGGSDTNTKASGAFNGPHGTTFAVPSVAFTAEIYVSNKKVWFVINDTVIHTFTADTATLASTLALPIRCESINSSGSAANVLELRVVSINRLGHLETDTIYKNIAGATGAGGTVLKYNAGRLHRVIMNHAPATATATIYDGVSTGGTVMATLTSSAQSGTPASIDFGCPFFTGLTVVTTGASSNLTVIYE